MKRFVVLLIIFVFVISDAANSADGSYRLKPLLRGIKNPWGLAVLDKNEFLITTKFGNLIHLKDGKKRVFNLNNILPIYINGQGGLLDIILSPDFEKNREFFVSFSMKKGKGGVTAVAKATFPQDSLKPTNWKIIFQANNYSSNGYHFGSRLAIDNDNYLYITIGDRRDRDKIQDLAFHNGKTIRINTKGEAINTNPFYSLPQALKDIYTLGHRNSQGMVYDLSHNVLYQSEHGPKGGDEINIIQSGKNYGWPVITLGKEYSGKVVGQGLTSKKGMEQPFINWTPSIAPSGLAYYNAEKFPEFKNTLISGNLSGKHLRIIYLESKGKKQTILFKGRARIRDVRTDQFGRIFVLTDGPDAGLYELMKN